MSQESSTSFHSTLPLQSCRFVSSSQKLLPKFFPASGFPYCAGPISLHSSPGYLLPIQASMRLSQIPQLSLMFFRQFLLISLYHPSHIHAWDNLSYIFFFQQNISSMRAGCIVHHVILSALYNVKDQYSMNYLQN